MGIISRFKDVMASNINALLDKCEDPDKMIDQYLRELEDDLAKVKAETASVMADEKAAKRKLDECNSEIEKMTEYAKKAVAAGNDGEAKQFLAKRAELTKKQEVLQKNVTMSGENATKMREMHEKLEGQIAELKSRKDMLQAKVKVAETQQKLNKLGSGMENAGSNIAAFDRMEEKVNKMLDEADSMAELNKSEEPDTVEALAKKYDTEDKMDNLDDELAALKAEMGDK
ncbi:MAG: PspA/IM30 family protein [Lachnospiraceae bacterium]|nr:PspA/IM30 family protein [Lachnospiraceae bacterium]